MKNYTDVPAGIYFLYADDDEDDQELFRSMVATYDPSVGLIMVNNGLELIQYLNNLVTSNLPCCIILDINMPIWDGIRTLKALKADQKYMKIPVVMFTTSSALRDNDLSLKLGASGYITKPVNHNDLNRLYNKFAEVCRNDSIE